MVQVSGTVIEQFTGNPISGAEVTASGRSTTTGPNGGFTLDLPRGNTDIRVESPDHESTNENLQVTGNSSVTIQMQPIVEPQ